VENCAKRSRQEREPADWHEVLGAVYSINGAGGANEMRACSACAGNYEDPDRTAWTVDDAEDEEREGARRASTEEFPAED
jgi:hypothetical protein